MSRGTEIAGTTLVFFIIGFFVDRWLGTTPWFMISLVILAASTQFLKLYYVYTAEMRVLEAQRQELASGR